VTALGAADRVHRGEKGRLLRVALERVQAMSFPADRALGEVTDLKILKTL
jgi:hypothetical protein